MNSAVLLLSSGLDSAANLALSNQFQVKLALTINYGQRGAAREREHASRLARHFGVEHLVYDLSGFSNLVSSKSALLGGSDVPVPQSLDEMAVITKTAEAVWVPNRNGVMISLAAALAEARGFDRVVVGFNAEEAVTFPDNTVDYMSAMSRSLEYSTANKVQVVSETARMNKTEIVRALAAKNFPFELLWSCYHAGETHCGKCESCQRLRRALTGGLAGDLRDRVLTKVFGSAESRST
jgi:7-cyano-7-deazaguanine synthase